jgi:hypothetical protein
MKRTFHLIPLWTLSAALLLTTSSWAKTEKTPPAPKPSPESIELRVFYGEKITDFLISIDKKESFVSMHSNQGDHGKKTLKPKDVDFLVAKFQKVPAKEEDTEDCYRKNIEATSERLGGKKEFKASACLDGKSQTAKGLLELANLLASWI